MSEPALYQVALQLLNTLTSERILSDWTTAEHFSQRTGISVKTLKNKRLIWPQGYVWQKAPDGCFYYSIAGFNQWMSQTAQQNQQPVNAQQPAPARKLILK